MATHLDLQEQEQVDALKAFWQQYGNLITWALVAALLVYAGITGWQWWQREQSVSVGAAGGKRAAQRVELADLADVTHDPLLASLRQRLRKGGAPRRGAIGLPCVFSREAVAQPEAAACDIDEPLTGGGLNCHGYG